MKEQRHIFDIKPELTLAMKLAATFAITYYGMLFLYEVTTMIFLHYSLDSYYFGVESTSEGWMSDFMILLLELVFSGTLVFSLIQIFRKKPVGKALFVGFSILLIVFQLMTSGVHPWLKYALEVLLVLLIAPIRMKKRVKIKGGKITLEEKENSTENQSPTAIG